MKLLYNLKRFKSLIMLFVILGIFIAGFQVLNSLYSYRGKGSYLTVLDKGHFNSNTESSHFAVEKIVKFPIPYFIKEYKLLDINKIAFISMNLKDNSYDVKTGIYDMAEGALIDDMKQDNAENQSNEGEIKVSPNGKLLLISYHCKSDELSKTYVYDVSTEKNIGVYNNLSAAAWLPGSNEFIGTDEYLFTENLTTGIRTNILKLSDYMGKGKRAAINLTVLKDGKTVCLYFQGTSNILSVDIESKSAHKLNINGDIYYTSPIDNTSIAVLGWINDIYGIYSYNIKNNTLKQLITISLSNEKFSYISMSEDGKNIVYCLINSDGINEIHVASLINNERLENDELVYKDSEPIQQPVFTKDGSMLYFLQSTASSSTIYRILLKAP